MLTEGQDFPRERSRCCKEVTSSQVSTQAVFYYKAMTVVSVEQPMRTQKEGATKQFRCHLQGQPSAKWNDDSDKTRPPIHQADESPPEDKKQERVQAPKKRKREEMQGQQVNSSESS